MKHYEFLKKISNRINNIDNTLRVLNRSKLSQENKIEQMGFLEEIKYEIISHDLVKESLTHSLSEKNNLNNWHIKLIERIHKNYSVLPLSLIKSVSQAKIECYHLWKLSNSETNNLTKLKERFADLIKLICEVASIRSEEIKCSKYESVIVADIKEKEIKEIFPQVGSFFNKNVDKLTETQSKKKIINLQNISVEKQIKLGDMCLQKLGTNTDEIYTYYDHIDSSIQYDESNFCRSLFSFLGLGSKVIYQKYISQTDQIATEIVNETQRLFMEKIIGTSNEFIEFIQPHIREEFAIKSKDKTKIISIKNLHLLFNKVNTSCLANKADEFNLLAHIMLRTKLEQDMIDGKLEVKDLHDSWLEGMKHYKIPINAKNELETYFQDEYWVNGIIGYFPIKMIAFIASVQIFYFIKKKYPELLSAITKGDFSPLIKYLSENLYSSRCSIFDTLKKITGKNLDIECYTRYLSEKYNLNN